MGSEIILAVIVGVTALVNYLRTRKVGNRVDHEFTNNGGSSARDVLDHLVVKLDRMEQKMDDHIENHP